MKNILGETPLHLAKTGKILDALLYKTDPKDVLGLEGMKLPLFDHIQEKCSASMKTYLNMMVTFEKSDSKPDSDDKLVFDLSLFNQTNEKKHYLDKHLQLLETGLEELKHPLMDLFMFLKYQQKKWINQINFIIYAVFLIIFTTHGLICVNIQQCEGLQRENATNP